MNATNITDDEYAGVDHFFTVLSIIVNLLTFPLVILLNTLIIIAFKTKRRLRTMHNILLGSMAVTDLAVGIVVQPLFITQQIFLMAGGSFSLNGKFQHIQTALTAMFCPLSLLHLALIAVERFVAMKYSLQYHSIVTKFRLTVVVSCCWFIMIVYSVTKMVYTMIFPVFVFIIVSVSIMIYCHISVYFVCRRHLAQIKSEQISREASTKFLEERKAWKTTTIIIAGVFISYSPGLFGGVVFKHYPIPVLQRMSTSFRSFSFSFYMLNSLLNPIIYCWGSKEIRQAMLHLLKKQEN